MIQPSVVAGLIVAMSFAWPGRQQPAPQPPAPLSPEQVEQARQAIAGAWRFEDDESQDDARNWRRPVNPSPTAPINKPGSGGATPIPGGQGGSAGGPGPWPANPGDPDPARRTTGTLFVNDAARALRDLLEVAATYSIEVGPETVTVTDDLDRVFKYSLTEEREKHRMGATEFVVKTRWDGPQLVQEITALSQLKISQVFLASSDGKSLFVWIKVEKPLFTPRIKDITRVYTRVGTG